jgi:diaminopimelate epimerase
MEFTKLQATGNDFIVIKAFPVIASQAKQSNKDWSKLAQTVCNRHFGVGADGLLLILPSEKADLRLRVFNPDGSEAEACGNGLRCVAKHWAEKASSKIQSGKLTIETIAGIRNAEPLFVEGKVEQVRLSLGKPQFSIPEQFKPEKMPLQINDKELALTFVSLSNPHAVVFIEEPVADFPLAEIGRKVEHHPAFPQRVNFEVVQVLDWHHLQARVWERGVGETLSCGSGAGAIAVAAHQHHYVDNRVEVIFNGGTLGIEWDGEGEVMLTGPVKRIFAGNWLEES